MRSRTGSTITRRRSRGSRARRTRPFFASRSIRLVTEAVASPVYPASSPAVTGPRRNRVSMVFVSVAVRPERSAIAVCSITVAALLSRPAARMPSTRFWRRTTAVFFFVDPLDTEFASCYYLDASRYTVDNNTSGGGCAQLGAVICDVQRSGHTKHRQGVSSLNTAGNVQLSRVRSCFMLEDLIARGCSSSSAVGPSGVLCHDLDSFC